MADDVSENRASCTKDLGTLVLRPGQIQGHTKSNQNLGSVSLCVQHASAFLWEPFLPFGQYSTAMQGISVERWWHERAVGEGMKMEKTERMMTVEKAGGTGCS